MQTTKQHRRRSKLHADEYVHTGTGETLEFELGDTGSAFANHATGTFSIESKDFVSLDTTAVEYLLKVLNKADTARVLYMSTMLRGECSVICQKNNHPHTSETLYTALGMSHDEFYKMVRRLTKVGVLAHCICAPTGHIQKVYLLNPFISRRRKTLNCELLAVFTDVTKVNV